MEWKELFVELMEMVRGSSTVVWEAARRQAMVEGVQCLIGVLCAAIVLLTCVVLAKATWRKIKKEIETSRWVDTWDQADDAFLFGLLVCISVAAFVCAFIFFGGSLARFINPDFYAIKVLVSLITLR